MRVSSNLQWPENPFVRNDRLFGSTERFLVSLDVEWTKNYRIKNGSRPFCYSIVILHLPPARMSVSDFPSVFGFKSVFSEGPDEEADLVASLEEDLRQLFESESILTGHQLSSDLSVVAAVAQSRHPAVDEARRRWHERRRSSIVEVFDTRYDVDHLALGTSRRLVDICVDVGLDVTQPELSKKSMTALYRGFLESDDPSTAEELAVLNLRHSLSTALVALLGMGYLSLGVRNVNQLLHQESWDIFEYVRSTKFGRLLENAR